MKYLRKIIVIFSVAWIIFGLVSFFFGLVCATGIISGFNTYPFPLGDPTSIAVDQDGRLYCALQFYQRIQVYDAQGQFLRNWHVPNAGYFALRVNEQNYLEVETREGQRYVFTADGTLLNQAILIQLENPAAILGKTFCTDPNGNRYEICNRFLAPHIIKISPQGESQIWIQMPFYQWLITGPLIPWLMILAGFIFLGCLQILEEKIPAIRQSETPAMVAAAGFYQKTEDAVLIPISFYLLLEPLAIILGSLIAIGMMLYMQNMHNLTFIRVSLAVVLAIVGMHAFLHLLFAPGCPLQTCKGKLRKMSDKPLQYRCSQCGFIYTKKTIDF